LGFVRRKALWNRKAGPFIDIIELQLSKAGDAITVNLGVLHMEVFGQCWNSEPPTFADATAATVSARVGRLIDGKDVWWETAEPALPEKVTRAIETFVLPFLANMHSLKAMEKFLEESEVLNHDYPLPIITLALVKHTTGDREAACQVLADLNRKTTSAWQARVSDVRHRLGCA